MPNETTRDWSVVPLSEHPVSLWLQSTIIFVISVLIIGSNTINLIVLRITEQLPKNTRFFLIQLCLSDLVFGWITCAPCVVTSGLGRWIYGTVWCQIAGLMHGTSLTVSMWCITMISIDRYLAIIHPLRYHFLITAKRCRIVFAFFWPLALLTFATPLALKTDFIYYQYSTAEAMCGLYWSFRWFPVVTALYIPILCGTVMSVTNYKIIRTVLRRKPEPVLDEVSWIEDKQTDNETVTDVDTFDRCTVELLDDSVPYSSKHMAAITNEVTPDPDGRPSTAVDIPTDEGLMIKQGQKFKKHKESKREVVFDTRVFKLLIFTTACYFAAWTPYIVCVLITAFLPEFVQSDLSKFIIIWLANSNSFMNVIIYSATYSSYRTSSINLVKKCFSFRCKTSTVESPVKGNLCEVSEKEQTSGRKGQT